MKEMKSSSASRTSVCAVHHSETEVCVCESGLTARLSVFQDRLLALGGRRTTLVQESICCDTADQKDESQRGAAETDGHGDTFTGRPTPGRREA